jgi:hypothetical protein
VSIRKNVDLVKHVDEVTMAQITIVRIVMRFLLFRFVPRPMQQWSTVRAKFENKGLSWSADRVDLRTKV